MAFIEIKTTSHTLYVDCLYLHKKSDEIEIHYKGKNGEKEVLICRNTSTSWNEKNNCYMLGEIRSTIEHIKKESGDYIYERGK